MSNSITLSVKSEAVNSEKVSLVDDKFSEKKKRTHILAESYNRLNSPKANRVYECGTFLEFKRFLNTDEVVLNRSNFCRVRLCPLCSWRRSRKVFGEVSSVMDSVVEGEDFNFLFLTLTCKNVSPENLQDSVDNLFNSFSLLSKRKKFKQAIKGWFRAFEITHNLKNNTYHPHFHVILCVNKSYFQDTRIYITQEEWVNIWKSCMKVDYNPIVDIRTFKKKKDGRYPIAEVAKYTVKENDFIIRDYYGNVDEEYTDESVYLLDKVLNHRRLISYGGILREYRSKVKKESELDFEKQKMRDDLEYIIEAYSWNVGFNRYELIAS